MRILVSEFHQETNSFNPYPSDLNFWLNGQRVLEPEAVRESVQGQSCALLGIIDALEQSQYRPEIAYGYSMFCRSGGTARQEVMDHYTTRLMESVSAAMPLDGVVLSFHGALQTDEYDDAEAEVVRRIRTVVGEECVIAASTDLHGYISRELIDVIDILAGYQTYPHTDFYETGWRAATLGLEAIAGPRKPVMAWVPVPMMVSASAYTDREGAFGELIAEAHRRVSEGRLLDFSIYQMQPWLDVAQPHSTVLAIAEDAASAAAQAAELARELYSRRHNFEPELFEIDDVIDLAEADGPKPVVLVDSADSGNGGAAGDSMAVASRLLARDSRVKAATVVNDTAAAVKAHELGVGAVANFRIGGSLDARAVGVEVKARVRSLHDGEFVQEGPAGRGLVQRIGRTAVLRAGNLDILVCEWTAGNGDPQLYRAFGIEQTFYDLVVVKANTSFRAGYSAFAGQICETSTPGAASPVIRELPFEKHPKEIYPWVDVANPPLPVRFARAELMPASTE